MSNNIYDILAKFPKDTPMIPKESEPMYESVDSRDELLEDVRRLEEKFYKYKDTPQVSTDKTDDASDFKIAKAKRELQLAMAEYPEAGSPTEALVARMGDQAEETKRVIDDAKTTIAKQQQDIAQAAQAVNDANARYAAQEKRFQDFSQQVVASELDVKQQAQAALDFAKQPQAKPADIISKIQAQAPQQATAQSKAVKQEPKDAQPTPNAPVPPPASTTTRSAPTKEKSADTGNVYQFPNITAPSDSEEDDSEEEEKKYGTYGESMTQNKKIIKEDRQEGDPLLGVENWGLISQGYQKALDQVVLSFAGNKLPITAPQMFGLVQVFNGMQPESKDMFVKKNLAFYNSTMQLLSSPQVVKAQEDFPEYQTSNPVWRKKIASTAKKYNPKQLDFFGTPNMSENINKMAKSLMERFMSFKESAKPDFLDLDKDGDTEEPMKAAAKDAKEHEPAKVDKSAVEKRKRLQALKDKQEDERAERGDYDTKSSTRIVKGRAYGGSAQKDDEEKDLDEGSMKHAMHADAEKMSLEKFCEKYGDDDWVKEFYNDINKPIEESGLQAYLGKKKYGKEGMKALQKAGREGASKEKMALIRARHDKMDEAQMDEVGYSAKAARAGKDIGKPGKAFAKIAKSAGERYGSKERGEKVAGAVLKKLRANEDEGYMDEVAPPGAKAERMVKHIKKGYSKDGKLTPKEKSIAYATAWKAKKAGKLEESRNHESSEYTYETVGRILCDEQPHLDCNSEAFVKAVYDELIELKMTPKAARWLCHYDEDFLSDTATSYKHFCDSKQKEMSECGSPMNAFVSEEPMVVDAVQELDEIARLAGLAPKMEDKCSSCGCADCECNESSCMIDEAAITEAATRKDFRMVADLLKDIPDMAKRTELALYHADIFKQQNSRFKKEMFLAAAGVDTTPIKDESVETEGNAFTGKLATTPKGGEFELDGKKFKDTSEIEEETATEGNEFSGALAKAKAAGEKEFEVDGKKYTVKEDINLNVSATGEEDVVNLIRKLSGMPVVAIQAHPAVAEELVAEEGPKERDIEYTNSPREDIAGTDAAIPAGADLNRAKKQYKKEYPGDNPMAVSEAKEEQLWKAYETMIKDLKV